MDSLWINSVKNKKIFSNLTSNAEADVCIIGAGIFGVTCGYPPKDTRTPAQRAALVRLVAEMRKKYPGATVHGHNEFANKACPSFNVQKEPELCGR